MMIKRLGPIGLLAIIPIALSAQASAHAQGTGPASPGAAQAAEQLRAAEQRRMAQEAGYLNMLAAAVRAEERDESWAARMETDIRTSYAAEPRLPRGALRSVDCRTSHCELQFQVGVPGQPDAAVEQQAAIANWIAANAHCGYTLAMERPMAQAVWVMHAFLDCARQQ